MDSLVQSWRKHLFTTFRKRGLPFGRELRIQHHKLSTVTQDVGHKIEISENCTTFSKQQLASSSAEYKYDFTQWELVNVLDLEDFCVNYVLNLNVLGTWVGSFQGICLTDSHYLSCWLLFCQMGPRAFMSKSIREVFFYLRIILASKVFL